MKNGFAQRFVSLKTKVGGNREKQEFEFTFGSPMEINNGITMPEKHIRRILSEMQFALSLNDEKGGCFDQEIDSALSILEEGMEQDGVITKSTALLAEKALLPLRDAAKEYEVLCVGHAHIDMNWMWGWQETVAATLATFRTMLNLMKEYPAFTFAQSQASVYRIVEEYDPEMMDEIRARIREGRWEVTASSWVENDKNMPDTESLLRHIHLTHDYLQSVWGVPKEKLNIDFSPDTFGHSAFIPEIDTFGGVRYMYHCRGVTTEDVIYHWQCANGKEILVCREPYWYNSGITPDAGTGVIELSHHSGGLKTGLIVYGVGNHGGGVTRRDIERILEMQEWPVFPKMSFGTFGEYFRRAESVREQLHVRTGELNAIFTGCYSTQSRIKRGNRRTEAALLDAEALSAMAGKKLFGAERAWRNVCFTHFHDILTGSCVQETREHAMGLYAESIAVANTGASKAITAIGESIDTSCYHLRDMEDSQSEGAGAGYGIEAYAGVPNPDRGRGKSRVYTVYNPTSADRDECVEITVWDWPFDLNRLCVYDAHGNALPFSLLTREREHYWDHKKIRLLVQVHTPGFGYATLCVDEREAEKYPTYRLADERTELPMEDLVLENECIRAVFSRRSGAMISFVDKADGCERLTEGKTSAPVLVDTEGASSDAWHIGRWLSMSQLETATIKPFANPVSCGFELTQTIRPSKVTTRVSLNAGEKALKYEMKVDWNESAAVGEHVPVLVFELPCGARQMRMDVPGGVLDRDASAQDKPGLTFAACVQGERALFLASDCKYGYRCDDGSLSVTLINTARYPDPYPERGIHRITLWVGVSAGDRKSLKDCARALNHPLVVCSTGIHPGCLPPEGQMLKVDCRTSVVTSLRSEDGRLVLRMNELEGQQDHIVIEKEGITKAHITDLAGNRIGEVCVDQHRAEFDLSPLSLAQVVLE